MTKAEFMNRLSAGLRGLPEDDVREIMFDYDEHFRMGESSGRTDDEIVARLGDPVQIARQYRVGQHIAAAEERPSPRNVWRALMATLSLGALNVFLMIWLWIAVFCTLLGFYAGAGAMVLAGLLVMAAPALPESWVSLPAAPDYVILAIGAAVASLGFLWMLGNIAGSRGFFRLTLRYLKWNLSVLRT